PQGRDLPELRRYIFGDSVDFVAVKRLSLRVFAPCKCREIQGKIQPENPKIPEFSLSENPENPRICPGHERCIPIQEIVETLDLREEGIETLLCYLELHPRNFLELFPPTFSRCRIRCSGGSRQLRELARSSPPLAVVLARERSAGQDPSGSVEFDVISLSDSMGWESPLVKRSLRQLQWNSKGTGNPRNSLEILGSLRESLEFNHSSETGGKSGITVEFLELSFHFRAFGDLNSQELDSIVEFLHSRTVSREKEELRKLRSCFRAFRSVAFQSCLPWPPDKEEEEKSSRLKELLREYFERDGPGSDREDEDEEEEKNLGIAQDWESQIRADIRHFLAIHPDETFSGRAIARIFHGIGSPRFPAQIYGRDRRFWRRHLPLEFQSLSRLATEEILAFR
ncbi:RECQ4 helicase, partial [Orthonyx spaldingii]|nr:RECQ4 helicase [Orthonyx spaldingii]